MPEKELTMLRLHHAPMACSLASRLALAASGLPHDIVTVNTRKGEQNSDAYAAVNPRAKVPALETAEGVITESSAILPLIADLAPESGLLPAPGTIERAKAQSWLAYLSCTLHPALSGAIFPERHVGCEVEAVKAYHLGRVASTFEEIDAHLADRQTLLDEFSLCDLYLFVFSLWRRAPSLAELLPALPNVDRLEQSVFAREGVAAIIADDMRQIAEGRE